MATSQLQALLDSFEARLSTVENSVLPGGASSAPMASGSRDLASGGGGGGGGGDELSPSVVAFDEHCSKCLDPFVAACDTLGGGAAAGVSRRRFWGA